MTELAQLNQTASAQAGTQRYSAGQRIAKPGRFVPVRPYDTTSQRLTENRREFGLSHALFLLRLSLATVFFWFGALKVANVSPVVTLLRASVPFMADAPYLQILGIAEIVIGMGLLVDRLTRQATALMICHLLATLSLLVIAPSVIFAPAFPVLTMDGEFVLKNVVLITSALVIVFSRAASRDL